MSDEETDDENEGFVVHKVSWRSRLVNRLVAKLDERYISSRTQNTNCKPRSARRLGTPSQRHPPNGAPQWAIAEPSSRSSSPIISSNEQSVLVDSASTPATPLPLAPLHQNSATPRSQQVVSQNTSTPSGSSVNSPRVQLQFDSGEDDDLEFEQMIVDATRHRSY